MSTEYNSKNDMEDNIMKKKILSLTLVVCLLLGTMVFASCNKKTLADVISEAIENTQKLDSYAADLEMNMKMDMQGVSMDVPMTISLEVEGQTTESPKLKGSISMTMLEQTVTTDMYSDGEWTYMVLMGQGMKMKSEEADSDYAETANMMLKQLPQSVFVDKEFTENADGSLTFTTDLSSEMFNEIFSEFANEMIASNLGEEGAEVEFGDAKITITVADGYIKEYVMEYTMAMDVQGVAADVAVVTSLNYTKYSGVTVTFPEGYENFEEMPNE